MKPKFKPADMYRDTDTAKDILNTVYGTMNKEKSDMNRREECLRMANEIVNGAREQDYGTPEDNFQVIADMWSSYLGCPVDKQDVANMMIMLKIARTKTGTGTDDCFVDMAGYAACAYEMNQEKPNKHCGDKPWSFYDECDGGFTFDKCEWGFKDGKCEYGDIKLDDTESSWMAEEHYPNKLEDKYPCYDEFSGLYFESNIREITEVIERMNQTLHDVGFVNIRSFYNALDLNLNKSTVGLGWCEEMNDHVVVSFYTSLEPDGSPCVTICFEPILYLEHIYFTTESKGEYTL